MSDTAPSDLPDPGSPNVMTRPRPARADTAPGRIVSLLGLDSRSAPFGAAAESKEVPPTQKWSSAVDLIREASEAIRVGEERAAELEAQLEHVVAQADVEIRRLKQDISTGEQRLAKTEERARLAEARAQEAEEWLVRLHDAAVEAFGGGRLKPALASSNAEETD